MLNDLLIRAARAVLPSGMRQKVRHRVVAHFFGPVTYFQDGLATTTNADCLDDPAFLEAYAAGKATGSWGVEDPKWRAYVCCWAARQAVHLDGDFVECGVNRGGTSLTVARLLQFERFPHKHFYLFDTYNGVVAAQLSPREEHLREAYCNGYYPECYEDVRRTFASYPNVVVVRGMVPDTLSRQSIERVAYLSIDMNCAAPEIAAAEFFWDRLVPGAVIVLDDYGFRAHTEQRKAFDAFAEKRGVPLLSMPTGQGVIVKP